MGLEPSRGQSVALSVGVQSGLLAGEAGCASGRTLPADGGASRCRLGVGLGVRSGAIGAVRLAVTPQQAVPMNRYWGLSIGATAGLDAIDQFARARPFLGGYVGVKVFPWGRCLDVLR